ncbi:MAG: hypothetical protein WBA10_00660 [Elainellaceae cyanobacterium]
MYDHPQPPSNESPSHDSQITLDFVQYILAADDGYCWEPSAPGSDAYLDQLEQGWLSQSGDLPQGDLSDAQFFETLDRAWEAADGATTDLETELRQSLGDRVPLTLLRSLLTKAQQIFGTDHALGSQLVHCVQGLVPQLDADDLQIMARPYALAMRDRQASPSLDTLHSSVRAAPWDDLIPIEQARLGLELSHYILSQLPHHPPGPIQAHGPRTSGGGS